MWGACGHVFVHFQAEAPGQPLWLPRGVGRGPWWTWWRGSCPLGVSRLGAGAPGASSTGLSLPVGWVPPSALGRPDGGVTLGGGGAVLKKEAHMGLWGSAH